MSKIHESALPPGPVRVIIEHQRPAGGRTRLEVHRLYLTDAQSIFKVYEDEEDLSVFDATVRSASQRTASISLQGRLLSSSQEDGTQFTHETNAPERVWVDKEEFRRIVSLGLSSARSIIGPVYDRLKAMGLLDEGDDLR